MQLNELKDTAGASKAPKRVGRGVGSGLGKTAGRGHKGQKSRSGVAIKGFEGGQNPIHMRLPKRGFNNVLRLKFAEFNLDQLQTAIDLGRLDVAKTIDAKALVAAGVVRRAHDGVRLLGRGALKSKVTLDLAGASASAVKAVEAAGGTISVPPRAKKSEAEEAPAKKGKKAAK
jgi:large subunit ribosomal protein L15